MNFCGATPFFDDAVAGTKATVKAAPGKLHLLKLRNSTAAVAYLQVFDALAASVTVGTTVPTYCIPLGANESVAIPFDFPIDFRVGMVIAGCTTPTGNTGAAIDVMATVS
jgi:hypothetical protein